MSNSKKEVAKTLLVAAGLAKFSCFLIEAQKAPTRAAQRAEESQGTPLSPTSLSVPMNARYGWKRDKIFYQNLQNSNKNNNGFESK